ncbi:hypothetical protein Bca101_049009 [Brassica carinata]
MSVILPLCLVLSMITYSNAAYCVCKDGNEQVLQKAIDYACGAGADCTQIQLNGACYQPNTIKNHCDVAVNSYYQKKASSGATCDFNGAAVISSSPPSTASSCLSGSSSSGTPSTGTPKSGTPTTGTPTSGFPSTGTPSTGNPTSGMPNTGTPSTSTGMPTSSSSSVFPGTTLGPVGSGGLGDPNSGVKLSDRTNTVFFLLAGVVMLVMMVNVESRDVYNLKVERLLVRFYGGRVWESGAACGGQESDTNLFPKLLYLKSHPSIQADS